MGKKLIDCSLDIATSDAWVQYPRRLVYGAPEPRVRIEPITTVETRGVYVCNIEMTTQCFTHIESSSHMIQGGRNIDEVPLEWFINDGVVIDMMHKKASEGVSADDLEKANPDVRPGDTIIIKTGWTDFCFGTRQFWAEMVHLKESAADWIVSKKPRALMQDFFTDQAPLITCEHCGSLMHHGRSFAVNHKKFLGADMILIEWCTNLGAITKPRVQVIALPLKIKGAEGGPARVIVIEDE